jgi:hypothetical protein
MARAATGGTLRGIREGVAMHTWIDGWDWLGMTLMMGFWLVVLGAFYIALRLGQRPPTKPRAGS